ncbi:MAG: tetratricopeptide repeat protein [Brevundimonas sp.]|uniref:tetratricopeptide repeat protein n=1 Tax=Brevundimonas sp. TaxID=1871086 RepID=UPI0027215915|nr:tetratricopeptide repeat protein [Brevundimonas sp.]MDO9077392.1 tetratricopeptide repeat protein [Brevundimonas sp.]MDP3080150.1 tetratricopeptide repeat protein [Brevundimonas sp.]MDZ4061737.1 tetratricopeptide repeat protein [Brevundimonas sp.]
MSRTTARIATVALLLGCLATPAMAQAQAAPPAAATGRQPATAEVRAAYERSDALSRQIFWSDQADIDPTDPVAGVRAAQALRELGRFDQAAEMASRVLVIQPANSDAMLELGRAHIARGQAFYGIAALEGARDARPADWRPWSLLGAAYEQVRRPDDARAAWAQALVLSPDNPDVLSNMAMSAMTRGDAAGAEPLLRRAVAQPGASLKVRLNLAMVLGLTGNLAEAEQMLRRDLPPEAADRNLAWLRERAGGTGVDQARTWGSLQGG